MSAPPPPQQCEPIIWPSRCRQLPALSVVTAAGTLPLASGGHRTAWETHTQAEQLGEYVPLHLVPHREQCSVIEGPFHAGNCSSCSFTWNKSRACPPVLLYCRRESHLRLWIWVMELSMGCCWAVKLSGLGLGLDAALMPLPSSVPERSSWSPLFLLNGRGLCLVLAHPKNSMACHRVVWHASTSVFLIQVRSKIFLVV